MSEPEELCEAHFELGDATWHDGPGWYYYSAEYPEEGSIGAFADRSEAEAHAREAGYRWEAPCSP